MNETPICIMSSGMEFWARTPLDAYHIILRDMLESDEDEAVGLALEAKALLEKEMQEVASMSLMDSPLNCLKEQN